MLGIMVRGDDSGLGNQTRRLTEFLKPERVLYVDSSNFSKNKKQHYDWYDAFAGYKVDGFPNNNEVRVFLKGLTHFYCVENPHNFLFYSLAKRRGIKTYCAANYEFCDNLANDTLPLPDKFLIPSYWHLDDMIAKFGVDRVQYLPPSINPVLFDEAREINFNRKATPRFLHIVGTLAANDRNGTLDLLRSLKYTKVDFELVIRSQHELPKEYMVDDRRVVYSVENIAECQDMYKNFDALILPRRYGGLSLTTNEALMSGLPVLMTDISPNNKILPKEWLFKARKKGEFKTRTMIDIYETSPNVLAEKIDWFVKQDMEKIKVEAFDCGYYNFSESMLRADYEKLWT